jgi:diphosphomevalonate decarboxylase
LKKSDVVHFILGERLHYPASSSPVRAFAATNIALCKYWGKRDSELNLPMTSSLSISLGDKGAITELSIHNKEDKVIVNGKEIPHDSTFYKRLIAFLDLFRSSRTIYFNIVIQVNIPIAAGLASSACGFASLVLALNQLFHWELSTKDLSILARLGSGSACRSIKSGFVEWHKGIETDGMDSYAAALPEIWPELYVGLLIFNKQEKNISSREAMQRTVNTSALYPAWLEKANQDLIAMKKAIQEKDFLQLGQIAESNALTMHALMLSAWPPISYFLPETLIAMQKIWELRKQGIPVYFTQDAGPHLKLLALQKNKTEVQSHFPSVEWVRVF